MVLVGYVHSSWRGTNEPLLPECILRLQAYGGKCGTLFVLGRYFKVESIGAITRLRPRVKEYSAYSGKIHDPLYLQFL